MIYANEQRNRIASDRHPLRPHIHTLEQLIHKSTEPMHICTIAGGPVSGVLVSSSDDEALTDDDNAPLLNTDITECVDISSSERSSGECPSASFVNVDKYAEAAATKRTDKGKIQNLR